MRKLKKSAKAKERKRSVLYRLNPLSLARLYTGPVQHLEKARRVAHLALVCRLVWLVLLEERRKYKAVAGEEENEALR